MNHRKNRILLHWSLYWAIYLLFAGCNNQSEHSGHEGMENMNHDMDKMSSHEMKKNDSIDLGSISLPTNYSVISSQKTVKPTWLENNSALSVNGYIALDERRDSKVSARFNGRIEKLFVKYNFQYVKKGEKIMEVYSAELNTAQEELLFLLKNNSDTTLARKAEEKLKLLGLSDPQLNEVKTTGKIINAVSVTSPYAGYVYFTSGNSSAMQTSSPSTSTQMKGMENGSVSSNSRSNQMNSSELQIREGSYVIKGQALFRVNDFKEVYAVVLIDNNHSSKIAVGMDVELISELDRNNIIKAKISFLEPILQNGQKFLSARAYLNNGSGLLKMNSLLTVNINSIKTKQLLIPNSSILFLGARKIVWVKIGEAEKGKYIFQVRDIATGALQGSMTEITDGLTDKDEIALDAGYMIDRESLIKSK